MTTIASSDAAAHEAPARSSYRADIDGLRALAILPILLQHCGVTGVRGGFVGVDIFFVISGYLITAIITRDLADNSFSITRFLRHRIVRILPALVVMVVVAAGCVIMLPNQIADLARSAIASSMFAANLYFYQTADYFAVASDAKPLIHLWSLAVEEQFYLLYPWLLVALAAVSRRVRAGVVLLVAVASFAVGGLIWMVDQAAAFFLLPGRIWELALGALVALGVYPTISHARLRALICLAAIGGIVASCAIIGGRWAFPVPFALAPAGAAAALIAYGEQGPTARLLSLLPLRIIGLLSYSLYLWHRPIISFYQLEYGTTLTGWDSVVLILASFAAASVSYLVVERPAIRLWRSGISLWPHILAGAVLSGGAACCWLITLQAQALRPLPSALAQVASYLGHDTTPAGRRQFSLDRCFIILPRAPFDGNCLRLAPNRPNIVLMGDSHAAHLSEALRAALPDHHLVQATAAGCLPLRRGRGFPSCRAAMERAFASIDFHKVERVILSARWLPGSEAALAETIRFVQQRGGRVLVIGPSAEYDIDLPTLIVRAAARGDPALPDRYRLDDRLLLDRPFAATVRATGARYFSAAAFECPGGQCRLLAAPGVPFHFDHSHLTPTAADQLVAAIIAAKLVDPRPAPPRGAASPR